MFGKILIGIAISFAPVFRGARHSRYDGVNLWQLMRDSLRNQDKEFGHPHLPYDEAVHRAQEAYRASLVKEE